MQQNIARMRDRKTKKTKQAAKCYEASKRKNVQRGGSSEQGCILEFSQTRVMKYSKQR